MDSVKMRGACGSLAFKGWKGHEFALLHEGLQREYVRDPLIAFPNYFSINKRCWGHDRGQSNHANYLQGSHPDLGNLLGSQIPPPQTFQQNLRKKKTPKKVRCVPPFFSGIKTNLLGSLMGTGFQLGVEVRRSVCFKVTRNLGMAEKRSTFLSIFSLARGLSSSAKIRSREDVRVKK